jgi:hypothetical protein
VESFGGFLRSNGKVSTVSYSATALTALLFDFQITRDGIVWGFFAGSAALSVINLTTKVMDTVRDYAGTSDFVMSFLTKATPIGDSALLSGDTMVPQYMVCWNGSRWIARKMGIEMPLVQSTTVVYTGSSGLDLGSYQYGIEYCYIENGVVVRSSGVSRLKSSGDIIPPSIISPAAPTYNGVTVVAVTPALDAESLASWTHARLWRSKNLSIIDGAIPGTAATLYNIRVVPKSSFISGAFTFSSDTMDDARLPLTLSNIEKIPTTPEVLELRPLQYMREFGVVGGNKLFMGNLASDPMGIYVSASQYASRYSEQYSPADRVGVSQGGGSILRMGGLGEDLIIATTTQFFRLPGADIVYPMVPLGSPGSLASRSLVRIQEGLGVVCLPVDGILRFMGMDYVWKDSFGFKSDGLNDLFVGDTQTDLLLNYSRGILSIALSGDTWYYQCLPGEGWTEKHGLYPIWTLWNSPASIVCTMGKLSGNIALSAIGEGSSDMASEVIFGPIQPPSKGDGIIEFMELRVEGEYADSDMTFYVSNNSGTSGGAAQTLPDWEYELESVENSSDTSARSHTYRIVSRDPLPSRAIGQRLFIRYSSSGESYTLNALTMRAIVQSGGQSMSRLVSVTERENMAQQQFFLSSLIQRYTRPNPLSDMYGNGDLSEI